LNGKRKLIYSIVVRPRNIDKPHIPPSLYRMMVEVTDEQGRVLDQLKETFGIRTIEIRKRHLFSLKERLL